MTTPPPEARTAYQRGNRDGLLNAAAHMERMRAMYHDEADKQRRAPGYRPDNQIHVQMARMSDVKATVYHNVAAELARLAEYLPDDPLSGESP